MGHPPTQDQEFDYGAGSPMKVTTITYASPGNGIVDRPACIQVTGGSIPTCGTPTSDTVSLTNYLNYDQYGNVGTIQRWVKGTSTPTYLSSSFTYTTGGLIKTVTDANGAPSTYTYTYDAKNNCPANSFPSSVAEPLSLSRSMTWDCNGGVLISVTDENGKVASASYTDPAFWRPHYTTDLAGNQTIFDYISSTQTESTLTFNGGTSVSDYVMTLDGLGRPSISQTKDGSNYDSVETTYDALGRPSFVSLPYSGAKGASCSGCPGTTTGYDPLSRVSSVSDNGGGSATYTYPTNDTYQTVAAPSTENPKRRQFQYDGLGRLTSVCEITSTANGGGNCAQTSAQTGYWTQYSYDVLGDLLGVTQNSQSATKQTRTYNYDGLGRLTSEANPETNNAANTYTYDTDTTCTGGYPAGNLVKRTDAAGNVACYVYDQLHRVTSVTYPSGPNSASTPTKYFVYDGATITVNGTPTTMANAKARLAEAYTGSNKITDRAYSYSARGEVTDIYSSTPNSNGYYHVSKAYWENGTLKTLGGIPGVPALSYGVDGDGRISTVSGGSQNPVISTSYNPAGEVTGVTFGSSDSDTYQYDANSDRMTQYSFNVNGQSVIGKLTWNGNGTLQKFQITQDPFNSANVQTCTYAYDDLARISSAGCGSTWAQTFSFDPFGNITKNGSISWMPGYTETNNRYSLSGTSYDNNGNLTADTFHTYQWDANGHPIVVGVSTFQSNQTYDALGNMVEQSIPAYSYIAQFLYDGDGHKLAFSAAQAAAWAWIPLPGGATAIYSAGTVQNYWHADWLDSSRFGSTPARGMWSDRAFAPFGEPYATAGSAYQSFAGMFQNLSQDLFETPNREYHPTQGRWITPDPAGLAAVDPSNPQTWNRYAYVRNNPLSFIDPLGLGCSANFIGPCPLGRQPGAPDGSGDPTYFFFDTPQQPRGPHYTVSEWDDLHGKACGVVPLRPCPANNGPQKACPAVPAHPANANVNSNIALTNFVYYANWLNPPTQMAFTDGWLVSMVAPNAPWDYKTQGQQYDAFGNFNFGATGAAAGIPLQVLQAGAGAVSTLVGTNSSQYGSWYQPPLYGHAPIKSQTIAAGYAYYQQGCK